MTKTVTAPDACDRIADWLVRSARLQKDHRTATELEDLASSMRLIARYITKLEAVGDSVRALHAQAHHQETHFHAAPGAKVRTSPATIGKGHGAVETISVED